MQFTTVAHYCNTLLQHGAATCASHALPFSLSRSLARCVSFPASLSLSFSISLSHTHPYSRHSLVLARSCARSQTRSCSCSCSRFRSLSYFLAMYDITHKYKCDATCLNCNTHCNTPCNTLFLTHCNHLQLVSTATRTATHTATRPATCSLPHLQLQLHCNPFRSRRSSHSPSRCCSKS